MVMKKSGENIVEVNDMLYKYLDFSRGEKSFDISTLSKKGVRAIRLKVFTTISIEGLYTVPPGSYNISFPLLNGRLPNNFTLTEGQCDITIEELDGVGDRNYWKIVKENDSGIPSYRN